MFKNKVKTRLEKSDKILLLTHENPDGDALGSLLAMALTLKKINKIVDFVCSDDLADPFLFLPKSDEIRKDFLLGDYDLIMILDCGDIKRTGFSDRLKEFAKNKKKIVNIDHHPKNDLHKISDINLIDYNASSTCEIIYELIKILNINIDKDIATCLLCGLYTDTGAFKHANTNSKVLSIASELLYLGARLKKITKNITSGKSIAALKLWGIALSRINKNDELGITSSFITFNDIDKCLATPNDLAGVVNMINSIPDSKVAILFSEIEDGKIKASLRTESDFVDVSKFAQIFGGGGLRKASGFTIEGHLVFENNQWHINSIR
jgi:phosphoesterase RecJ-like protein